MERAYPIERYEEELEMVAQLVDPLPQEPPVRHEGGVEPPVGLLEDLGQVPLQQRLPSLEAVECDPRPDQGVHNPDLVVEPEELLIGPPPERAHAALQVAPVEQLVAPDERELLSSEALSTTLDPSQDDGLEDGHTDTPRTAPTPPCILPPMENSSMGCPAPGPSPGPLPGGSLQTTLVM